MRSRRGYSANLLGLAVQKCEIQAIADSDPNLYLLQKTQPDRVEIATTLFGEYREKVCWGIPRQLDPGMTRRPQRCWAIMLSKGPAQILAEIVNNRPCPRRRGDPHLAALRHEMLRLLGLDAGW